MLDGLLKASVSTRIRPHQLPAALDRIRPPGDRPPIVAPSDIRQRHRVQNGLGAVELLPQATLRRIGLARVVHEVEVGHEHRVILREPCRRDSVHADALKAARPPIVVGAAWRSAHRLIAGTATRPSHVRPSLRRTH